MRCTSLTPSPSRITVVLNVDYILLYFVSLAWCSDNRNYCYIFFPRISEKVFNWVSVPSTLIQNPDCVLSFPVLPILLMPVFSCSFTTSQLCRTNSSNLYADAFMWKTSLTLNLLCLDLSSLSDLPQLTPFHLAYFPCLFVHFVLFSLLMRY